jgi:hypothetical protein
MRALFIQPKAARKATSGKPGGQRWGLERASRRLGQTAWNLAGAAALVAALLAVPALKPVSRR